MIQIRIYIGANNKAKIISTGTNNGNTNTEGPVTTVVSNLPVGFIVPYASNNTPPKNYMLCNGQELDRTKYKTLFNVIGTIYGEGDGENTFNLPKINNRFIEGGDTAGIEKEAGLPSMEHTHTGSTESAGTHTHSVRNSLNGSATGQGNTLQFNSATGGSSIQTSSAGAHTHAIAINGTSPTSDIYGKSDTVQPPSITMKYYIVAEETNTSSSGSNSMVMAAGIPLGTILPYMGDEAPENFEFCNGASLLKESFSDLYSVLGDKFGNEDELHFNLPDLNNRFLEGGDKAGELKEAGLPNITGAIDNDFGGITGNGEITGVFTNSKNTDYAFSQTPSSTHTFTKMDFNASKSNPIYGASETVQPASMTVRYIIKTVKDKTSSINTNTNIGAGETNPIGTLINFAGNGSVPNGYLLCDGAEVKRLDYPELFKVIGTLYGEGDGETTFNLPNYTDKFAQGSATAGTVKQAGLPNIKGEIIPIADKTSAISGGASQMVNPSGALQPLQTGVYGHNNAGSNTNDTATGISFDASRSNSIYSDSVTTVQPPALTCRILIKAKNIA